jgi:hypothetical protein
MEIFIALKEAFNLLLELSDLRLQLFVFKNKI